MSGPPATCWQIVLDEEADVVPQFAQPISHAELLVHRVRLSRRAAQHALLPALPHADRAELPQLGAGVPVDGSRDHNWPTNLRDAELHTSVA